MGTVQLGNIYGIAVPPGGDDYNTFGYCHNGCTSQVSALCSCKYLQTLSKMIDLYRIEKNEGKRYSIAPGIAYMNVLLLMELVFFTWLMY